MSVDKNKIYIVTRRFIWDSIHGIKYPDRSGDIARSVVGVADNLTEALPIGNKGMSNYYSYTIYRKEIQEVKLERLEADSWRDKSLNLCFKDGSKLIIDQIQLDTFLDPDVSWRLVENPDHRLLMPDCKACEGAGSTQINCHDCYRHDVARAMITFDKAYQALWDEAFNNCKDKEENRV